MLSQSLGMLTALMMIMTILSAVAQNTIPIQAQSQLGPAAQLVAQAESQCAETALLSPLQCIELEYETPTTIVLHGHLLINNRTLAEEVIAREGVGNPYSFNTLFWKVIDDLKARGFVIDSVMLAGQGTEPNPHVYHVVMSKP